MKQPVWASLEPTQVAELQDEALKKNLSLREHLRQILVAHLEKGHTTWKGKKNARKSKTRKAKT